MLLATVRLSDLVRAQAWRGTYHHLKDGRESTTRVGKPEHVTVLSKHHVCAGQERGASLAKDTMSMSPSLGSTVMPKVLDNSARVCTIHATTATRII